MTSSFLSANFVRARAWSADGRPAVGPGARRLDLRAELEQHVLAGRATDDLHGGRQAVVTVEERQHERRLAGRVEPGRERGEAPGRGEGRERVLRVGVEL